MGTIKIIGTNRGQIEILISAMKAPHKGVEMSKRSKACAISRKVKEIVWNRDNNKCISCGRYVPMSCANAHFIARSHSGLGIEQNILTLCPNCHFNYDNSDKRKEYRAIFKQYLKEKYQYWNEEDLVYNKWKNFGKT